MIHAEGPKSLRAERVRQDEITMAGLATVEMPLEVPIERQTDNGDGSGPEARRNGGVRKIQNDEIGLPPGRQSAEKGVPRIGIAHGQVQLAGIVKGNTVPGGAFGREMFDRKISRNGTDQIPSRHESSPMQVVTGKQVSCSQGL
jgi:hypothetical protein